jgi:hypothetical protein
MLTELHKKHQHSPLGNSAISTTTSTPFNPDWLA